MSPTQGAPQPEPRTRRPGRGWSSQQSLVQREGRAGQPPSRAPRPHPPVPGSPHLQGVLGRQHHLDPLDALRGLLQRKVLLPRGHGEDVPGPHELREGTQVRGRPSSPSPASCSPCGPGGRQGSPETTKARGLMWPQARASAGEPPPAEGPASPATRPGHWALRPQPAGRPAALRASSRGPHTSNLPGPGLSRPSSSGRPFIWL